MTTRNRAAMIRKIERRIRAKYVKRCWLFFAVALILGLAAGIALCMWGPLKTVGDSTQSSHGELPTDAVTLAPSETPGDDGSFLEPTATPEPEITDAPVVEEAAEPTAAPAAEVTAVPAAEGAQTSTGENSDSSEANTADASEGQEGDASALLASNVGEMDAQPDDGASNSEGSEQPEQTTENENTDASEGQEDDASALLASNASATDAQPDDGASSEGEGEVASANLPMDENGNVIGTLENPIPLGQEFAFDAEIVPGGTPRYSASMEDYDTLSMKLSLLNYLTPDYFVEKYSTQYKLTGSEAGAELSIALEGNTGDQVVNPQDVLLICFESENGDIAQGYQLMNAEIAGDYGVPLEPGDPQTYYKRFAYTTDPEMDFLTVTYYVDGNPVKVYFALEASEEYVDAESGETIDTNAPAEEETTYESLANGAEGEAVQKLQARLIELGYLTGDADGKFGPMTQAAISAAQTKAGMEDTGVADNAFQQYIYSEDAQKAE